VKSLDLDARGALLVSGSADNTARIWDMRSGKPLGPQLRHQSDVLAVAISVDGKRVLTGTEAGLVRLWDVATGLPPPPWCV
jgi:WD40 repeat protein